MDDQKFEKLLRDKLTHEVDENFDKVFWNRLEAEKTSLKKVEAQKSIFDLIRENLKLVIPICTTACLVIVVTLNQLSSDPAMTKEELFVANNKEILENLDMLIVMEENDLTVEELELLLEESEENV